MGNRKQPFGYRVVMGEIALHPQESKLVEYIFQQYLAGATYNTLVEELRKQSIPYDEGKLWNKNMVARMLEDNRYTGAVSYTHLDVYKRQRQTTIRSALLDHTKVKKE